MNWIDILNWIIQAFISLVFGGLGALIVYRLNRRQELERERRKREEDERKKYQGDGGVYPKDLEEAVRQARREGREIFTVTRIFLYALIFVVGTFSILRSQGVNFVPIPTSDIPTPIYTPITITHESPAPIPTTPAPPLTDTPFLSFTDTPTPTQIPAPISCNAPIVTRDVFPQLAEINRQFPFYLPLGKPGFDCQAVFDIFHNEPIAVRIKYENFESNVGVWGFIVPSDSPFDVSRYSEICFWAYAQQPNQAFHLRMKDTSLREDGIIILIEDSNEWSQICIDLIEFSDLGIQLTSIEIINLVFNSATGSAEIWVDDFEFR